MKIKIVAIIMAVLMVAGVVAFAVTKNGIKPEVNTEPVAYSYEASAYTAKQVVAGSNGQVFLPTDESGIFYTADLDNKIEFYSFNGGGFTPVSFEKKQATFRLSASYESIPVKVTYIDTGKRLIGYGVFTADKDKSVDVYDFAFVKIAKAPSGYGVNSGYLLLADFNKDEFYKADKTFSEIYSFNPDKSSLSTILSNNTRLIDRQGGFRQDWSMLTDDFLKGIGGEKYFMSSRYYSEAETGLRTDIMVYSSAYRPEIVVKDILGTWFVKDDKGMHYLKRTDEGFKCVVKKDKKESVVQKFEGDLFENYLTDGNFIVNKQTGEMINLISGDKAKFSNINLTQATVFALSPDATKAVFACPGEQNENGAAVQRIIYCSTDNSKAAEEYSEPLLYIESAGFEWADNNTVLSVRALNGNGTDFGSVLYTY